MHSNSEAIAQHSVAFSKTEAAMEASSRVLAALDYAVARIAASFRRAAEARRRHRDMVETIALLSSLDNHQLRDIGVERGQIVAICQKLAD